MITVFSIKMYDNHDYSFNRFSHNHMFKVRKCYTFIYNVSESNIAIIHTIHFSVLRCFKSQSKITLLFGSLNWYSNYSLFSLFNAAILQILNLVCVSHSDLAVCFPSTQLSDIVIIRLSQLLQQPLFSIVQMLYIFNI